MIQINKIRNNLEQYKKILKIRKCNINLDHLLKLDDYCKKLCNLIDLNNKKVKENSKKRDKKLGKELKQKLSELNEKLCLYNNQKTFMLNNLHNFLNLDTPIGDSDKNNICLYEYGYIPQFDFEPLSHEVLGNNIGILDLQRGSKVSGKGFYYWVGDGVRLCNAVYNYAFDFLKNQGFIPLQTPLLTNKKTLYGTGYLPFFQDDILKIENKDLSLIGTSEQTILGFKENEVLENNDLPLCYISYSPCFRSEAGSAGKASRGAFRVHQFHKLEQIIICKPEESENWHYQCQLNVEHIMKSLNLPFRVVNVCVGDMGAPGYKKFDTETWFPGFNEYKETHSITNFLDYQSLRLKIRYRGENKKKIYPHTISATAVTDRVILAIIENFQTQEGIIKLPKIISDYMNQEEIIPIKRNNISLEIDKIQKIKNREKINYKRVKDLI